MCQRGSLNNESPEEVVHMQVSTIGVDLAKNVFQMHGVDNAGKVVITRQLRRKQVIDFLSKIPACLVGMEACGTAHYWAREISKLGHDVRLMPPSYVKGYVKRSKNDAADAAAICEAVTRPSMRFVPIKSADQQALLMLHRTRDLLIRQRTQLINALRAHLAEFGLVAETGREGLAQLAEFITDEWNREALPSAMKQALQAIVDQLAALELQIGALDRAIHAHHRANDMSCRLEPVPGLCGISKQGDRYLRRLLVIGATSVVQHARRHPQKHPWIIRLLARKPAKLVAGAVANKMARIAWTIMAKGGPYRAPELAAAA